MKNLGSPRQLLYKLLLASICIAALSSAFFQAGTAQAAPADTGVSCQITYSIGTQWLWNANNPAGGGGFSASLTIQNTGATTINGWTLQFAFPNGQVIFQGFGGGSFTQTGANVTIHNLSFNGTINPGSTALYNPGFNANWWGTNDAPASMTLNGILCTLVVVKPS